MPQKILPGNLLTEYRYLTQSEQLTQPTLETVTILLKRHYSTFSFSTLAANLGEKIIPESVSLTNYLFENKSGLCFHHSNIVYEVLKDMGFSVELIACRFRIPNSSQLYPIPTHVAIILTTLDGKYLVDPGLGFAITEVVPLDSNNLKNKSNYRVVKKYSDHFELQEVISCTEVPYTSIKIHYEFDYQPVAINDFQDGINTLIKEDKYSYEGTLVEQGHLFFSMFFFSSLIDGKFKSVIAVMPQFI